VCGNKTTNTISDGLPFKPACHRCGFAGQAGRPGGLAKRVGEI